MTGASGLLGSKLVDRLRARGDEVTTLSRNPSSLSAVRWLPEQEPAPAAALSGRDAVVHLAGENVSQRWSDDAKRRIRSSRELGTRNLVAGIEAAEPRPQVLVSASAVGYYGPHGDERIDEQSPPGDGFLAEVCAMWEREAQRATDLGLRVVNLRTGVPLDAGGGALAKMLPFFKLGIAGPVA
ncbi:MAG TPA: NAD-dependent epimerase/dehydratase family protein, partial [Solirubrobacteraceae bacterium]|nr:NAD-dependent epimerase/dehydratase family protein [Solirubrobacteraceae bacterium]